MNLTHAKIMYHLNIDCLDRIARHFKPEVKFYMILLNLSQAHADLAIDALGQLKQLRLDLCWKMSDEHLRVLLQKCHSFQGIDLDRCHSLTANSLSSILEFHDQVLALKLSNCNLILDNVQVGLVVSKFANLCSLDVESAKQLDRTDVFKIATHCRQLESINFSQCSKICDDDIIFLSKQCTRLHTVVLSYCYMITLKAITVHIASQLQCLNLYRGSKNCIDRFWPASHFPALRILNLAYTDAAIESLHCPQLEEVNFTDCRRISGDALASFVRGSKRLRLAFLHGTLPGVSTIRALANCPDLVEADLRAMDANDHYVAEALVLLLNRCKQLRAFSFSYWYDVNQSFIALHSNRPGPICSRGMRADGRFASNQRILHARG